MDFFNLFIHTFFHYLQELWFVLIVGFLLAGVLYKFFPSKMIERHLGGSGIRPIGIASIVGAVLPLCCIGVLPVAVTLRRRGASLGAVLAFLVATPATSISAVMVCWKLLGTTFTIAIFFAAMMMALVIGIVGDGITASVQGVSLPLPPGHCDQCEDAPATHQSFLRKIPDALKYAFITLPRAIGLEILLAIAVASLIVSFTPLRGYIHTYLTGPIGYGFVLIFGLLDYTCSTASVPLADALIKSGLTSGQAFCYLLVGPITSYGTMLVIKKEFGGRILGVYLGLISVMSLVLGVAYDLFLV